MLPKVVSTAAVYETVDLINFHGSHCVPEHLPIYVLISDLEPVLIYLK